MNRKIVVNIVLSKLLYENAFYDVIFSHKMPILHCNDLTIRLLISGLETDSFVFFLYASFVLRRLEYVDWSNQRNFFFPRFTRSTNMSNQIRQIRVIVNVITFYSPSCLGQETAKGPFGLRVKQPPAHLSATHGGGFTLFLLVLNVKQESCEYQFL